MTIKHHIETLPNGLSFKMIEVEGGTFMMGGSDGEELSREKPVHEVSLKTFFMGEFPVTQVLWEKVMGNNPAYFKGDNRPIEEVSWIDSQDFLKKLNKLTRRKYRLPTEAEWEFAARGGIYSEEYIYSGSDRLAEVGWYGENSNNETHPVGEKLANELGFYDMSGNVWEWVEDNWHDNYHGAPIDGSSWLSSSKEASHVYRGGCWFTSTRTCRVSFRRDRSPDYRVNILGFRLALSLQLTGKPDGFH